MAEPTVNYDDYSDWVDCWQCFGDGGWASCMSDCCPFEGGEEMCTRRECWSKCDVCEGKGGWDPDPPRPIETNHKET